MELSTDRRCFGSLQQHLLEPLDGRLERRWYVAFASLKSRAEARKDHAVEVLGSFDTTKALKQGCEDQPLREGGAIDKSGKGLLRLCGI